MIEKTNKTTQNTLIGLGIVGGGLGLWYWLTRPKVVPNEKYTTDIPVTVLKLPVNETILIDLPTLETFISYKASEIDLLVQNLRSKDIDKFSGSVDYKLIPQIAEYEQTIATLNGTYQTNLNRLPDFDAVIATQLKNVQYANSVVASATSDKNWAYNYYNAWFNSQLLTKDYGSDNIYLDSDYLSGIAYRSDFDTIPVKDSNEKVWDNWKASFLSQHFLWYTDRTANRILSNSTMNTLVQYWNAIHSQKAAAEQTAKNDLANAQADYKTSTDNKAKFVADYITPFSIELTSKIQTLNGLKTSLYVSLTVYQKILAGS